MELPILTRWQARESRGKSSLIFTLLLLACIAFVSKIRIWGVASRRSNTKYSFHLLKKITTSGTNTRIYSIRGIYFEKCDCVSAHASTEYRRAYPNMAIASPPTSLCTQSYAGWTRLSNCTTGCIQEVPSFVFLYLSNIYPLSRATTICISD